VNSTALRNGTSFAPFPAMDNLTELAALLTRLGCPAEKSLEMAGQLDKRARQLSESKGKTYEEAMDHLLNLMKQGWAAKEKGA